MNIVKLRNSVELLSRLIKISDEQKEAIIDKCTTMSDKDVIDKLSETVYYLLGNNLGLFSYSLEVIRNLNPSMCPQVPEMRDALIQKYGKKEDAPMSLEDNHKLIDSALVDITKLLNEAGVDYYIVGALPSFIKTQEPLFRMHNKIDVMVNEADLPKVKSAVESLGYVYQDDRFPTMERYQQIKDGKHAQSVMAQNPNNKLQLGFITFVREEDNTLTTTRYSSHEENGQVVVDLLERKQDPLGYVLRYDDTPTQYNGTSFRTSTVENVYQSKGYTNRPTDAEDMERIGKYVDQSRLLLLRRHPLREEVKTNITMNSGPQPMGMY